MTRVGAVSATPNEATAPVRKGAPRDDGTTPFADALLDLLATMPQPVAKPVAVKTPPPAPSGDGTDAAPPPADNPPAALLQAALPDATAAAAATNAATPVVVTHPVVTTGAIAGADAAAVDLSAANATAKGKSDQPADATTSSAEPSAVPPDATTAAMQIAAAFALAVNGAGMPAPVITVAPPPRPAGTQAATTPSQPAVGSVDGAATPGSSTAAALAGTASTATISALPQAQFAAGFITLTAQWHPPVAAATTADALAGDAGDDAATPATDATTATAAAPLPDGLAQLLAATVRQVSHASPDAEPASTTPPSTHHAATTSDDANGSAPSGTATGVAAAATTAAAAYPAVAAGAPVPLLNGGQLPSAPVDPGPRQMPEPKGTPAPTAHATLELDADKTGASRIRIAVQGSQVRATITASDIGLASLDRQLPELRRSLEERGFSDIRLAVRAQDHVGTVATNASPTADDTQSFTRNRSDQQAQGSTQQQDTGDRAGSQRRRRQKEDEPS